MTKEITIVLLLIIGLSFSNLTIKAADYNTDTLTIYFDFGSADLSKTARGKIRNLSSNYTLQDVDSVS